MGRTYKKLCRCAESVREKTDFVPRVAVTLGSGLGGFAGSVKINCEISYKEIEGFPVSTVSGHEGSLIFGYYQNIPVVVMRGRVHYYEGYDMGDVVLPVRLMGLLGAKSLVLTNAAGGVDPNFSPGDIMLLKDHVSLFVPSPLRGENEPELGTRFPDMSAVYDSETVRRLSRYAYGAGITLKKGTYAQLPGPQYETPEEIRLLRILGVHAVGMSTVCEAIAARHMNMKVCGISCITNMAAGISKSPLAHEEVKETAKQAAPTLEKLLGAAIKIMDEAV